jgi:ubiquinone/menaquinone biosynthesis C-methylase UbiE
VNCYWRKRISYIFGDLRHVPIQDCLYDTIVCCSVLEHVGLDNTIFTQVARYHENSADDFVLVMREFRRLLKPSGTLLLTVPFGRYHHGGWYQQFDRSSLNRAINAFGQVSTIDECYYRHFPDGWNIAQPADCIECEYQERGLLSRADAIACVQIVK